MPFETDMYISFNLNQMLITMATLLCLSCKQRCHDPHFNTMHIHLIWVTLRRRMDQSGWGRRDKMGDEVVSSWTQRSKGRNYSHTNTRAVWLCCQASEGNSSAEEMVQRASLSGRRSVNLTLRCYFFFDRVLYSLETDETKFTDII